MLRNSDIDFDGHTGHPLNVQNMLRGYVHFIMLLFLNINYVPTALGFFGISYLFHFRLFGMHNIF